MGEDWATLVRRECRKIATTIKEELLVGGGKAIEGFAEKHPRELALEILLNVARILIAVTNDEEAVCGEIEELASGRPLIGGLDAEIYSLFLLMSKIAGKYHFKVRANSMEELIIKVRELVKKTTTTSYILPTKCTPHMEIPMEYVSTHLHIRLTSYHMLESSDTEFVAAILHLASLPTEPNFIRAEVYVRVVEASDLR